MSIDKWTEARVYSLLNKVFPDDKGAYALLPHVMNGMGYVCSERRTADAIAVSCHASRGIWMAGIEIKVSLQDWRKELASPEKAESIQKFCKYWYVACPKGVIPVAEIPEKWGLIECHSTGAKITKPAIELECVPPDINLVASIVRNILNRMTLNSIIEERVNDRLESSVKVETNSIRNELEQTKKRIEKFKESSGVDIDTWSAGNIGEAVKTLLADKEYAIDVDRIAGKLNTVRKVAQDIISMIDKRELR